MPPAGIVRSKVSHVTCRNTKRQRPESYPTIWNGVPRICVCVCVQRKRRKKALPVSTNEADKCGRKKKKKADLSLPSGCCDPIENLARIRFSSVYMFIVCTVICLARSFSAFIMAAPIVELTTSTDTHALVPRLGLTHARIRACAGEREREGRFFFIVIILSSSYTNSGHYALGPSCLFTCFALASALRSSTRKDAG